MIQFKSLRLQGFKSFVDRTELDITAGLTGIVGPNGCGKSNLVEAMRWVMGEASAKRMRGSGMEDVIFSGTSDRPKRNIAEAALVLDNSARTAPAPFNKSDEIEIVRKIERDQGSVYKINGKTSRARDVQILLADTLTGANSPALVSQGRVSEMINAKPVERRMILEESAGISGLYARRHEAELRLKAAETNLQRIEDLTGSMESRLNTLKRQARQAARYRNISAQCRQLEILIAYLEWLGLKEKLKSLDKTYARHESEIAARLETVSQLTKTQTTQSRELPALRQEDAKLSATLQTHKLALQKIENEEEHIKALIAETQLQYEQNERDIRHEKESLEENAKAIEKIKQEQEMIAGLREGEEERLAVLEKDHSALEAKVEELEKQYTVLTEKTAERRAKRENLKELLTQLEQRKTSIQARLEKSEQERDQLLKSGDLKEKEKQLKTNLDSLKNEYSGMEQKAEELQKRIKLQEQGLSRARQAHQDKQREVSRILVEINMLESLFDQETKAGFSKILDLVKAQSGFEKALSRALGDSLLGSTDTQAPSYWKGKAKREDLPALPQGASSLIGFVDAPDILQPALSQIGHVESQAAGEQLSRQLKPGQSLVSGDGDYWRWDGYCIKADAKDRNAEYLEQKNKLGELRNRRQEVENELEAAAGKFQKAERTLEESKSALENLRSELQARDRETDKTLAELNSVREQNVRHESALAHITENLERGKEELDTIEEDIKEKQSTLKLLEESADEDHAEKASQLKETLLEARENYQNAIRHYERIVQEKNSRKARMQAIGDERVNLKNRAIRSTEQLKNLQARNQDLRQKLDELQNKPLDAGSEKQELIDKIALLEKQRMQTTEKLALVEEEVAETGRALKEAEKNLAQAKEDRAHTAATLEALREQESQVESGIQEKFDMPASELKHHLSRNLDENAWEKLAEHKAQKEKLVRERDAMGPVNLRADQEAEELEKEVGAILKERNDLSQAVEELRGGIQKINKEARDRLTNAFDHINGHFQNLFTRLFQGGQAHLSLIDAEDPLGTGLEIYAQPPGKTLQSLSLLSGGEQALASIALIFAMFLTNPSPVCVLDEIDAPLDDANVDRVCDLLEEIAERRETRFLIITHHRLTMARMDRLYGVTMAEKGVSQLVSVDLQQSFDFLEEAA